jgi:crossover junction endodeoxyribonuclease RuvC
MKYLWGIDPGYDRIGWAIGTVEKRKVTIVDFGCWQTDKKQSFYQRLIYLQQLLTSTLDRYPPAELAIETLAFGRNTTTALPVSEARGVIIAEFLRLGVVPVEYRPSEIKLSLTGHGNSDKADIARQLQREFKVDVEKVKDDALDAVAILVTHGVSRGSRLG